MQDSKHTCLQCKQEKPLNEYFIYKKSMKPYSWCKKCMLDRSNQDRHARVERAKEFRQRWGISA